MRKIEEATRCASGPAKPLVSGDAADLTRGAFFGLAAIGMVREGTPYNVPFRITLSGLARTAPRFAGATKSNKVLMEFHGFGEAITARNSSGSKLLR